MKEVYESLDEVVRDVMGKECLRCGKPIENSMELGFYPHEGGWFVKSLGMKVWLYVVCQNCGYRNSIWKLLKQRKVLQS